MKVYVIMKGHYSDRHICGVAVDADVAEEIRRVCSDPEFEYDEAWIETYETDDWSALAKGGKLYHVERLSDGTLNCQEIADNLDWEYDSFVYGKKPWKQKYYDGDEKLCVSVIALGNAQAKKIAVDKFTQFLAEEAGI